MSEMQTEVRNRGRLTTEALMKSDIAVFGGGTKALTTTWVFDFVLVEVRAAERVGFLGRDFVVDLGGRALFLTLVIDPY